MGKLAKINELRQRFSFMFVKRRSSEVRDRHQKGDKYPLLLTFGINSQEEVRIHYDFFFFFFSFPYICFVILIYRRISPISECINTKGFLRVHNSKVIEVQKNCIKWNMIKACLFCLERYAHGICKSSKWNLER